jgi:DNA-binding NarL/FixJ family response regulator
MGVLVTDVERLLLEAWEKLGPRIMADGEELQRRLARRRSKLFERPQRAWCVCLRAADRRITPMDWIFTPEHAMDLDHPEHPYEPIEHTVTIQPHGLRKCCRAVRTDSMGELVENVAGQLGKPKKGRLLRARRAGVFTERFVKGLGARWGPHPVPLIHSWQTLDPSGRNLARPEQLWGSMWEWLPDMIPDDFRQDIVRRPMFRAGIFGRGGGDPDHVYKDEMEFWGWKWVCPACKKTVNKIYYPVAPQTLFDYLGYDPGRATHCRRQSKKYLPYDVHDVPTPPGTFACGACHGVVSTTRTKPSAWNEVVSWLSRGMLYGHEVEKPQWYRAERKVTRHRKLGKPAARREAVFNRLRLGWPLEEIALKLVMKKGDVSDAVSQICRQERVKNRTELAAKLGWTHRQPLNGREKIRQVAKERDELVEKLLLEGLVYKAIAQRLGMAEHNVEGAAMRIYRKHGIVIVRKGGRKAFMERFGVGKKKAEVAALPTDAIGGL